MSAAPWPVVVRLGVAQTLAWASTYYLPTILAAPIAGDLGLATPTVFLAFSAALVVSALLGPLAGRLIDRHGGRLILCATSLIFAAGLACLGMAGGPVSLFAAWLLLGAGMAAGLYEGGFAALVHLYGHQARGAITGITLLAGFASTVGWPLSTLLEAEIGWRGACFGWALLHLAVGLPLNALLPSRRPARAAGPDRQAATTAAAVNPAAANPAPATDRPIAALDARQRRRAALLLGWVFGVGWFISTSLAAHWLLLLDGFGATPAAAIVAGSLIGPAQVAARLLEFGLLRRWHPLVSARLACLGHPAGALTLLAAGAPAAPLFALLHGAGNGIMTIAKGTLPLALFGPAGYGRLQGLLSMPARFGQAVAPFVFGLLLESLGNASLVVTIGLALTTLIALAAVPAGASPGPDRRPGRGSDRRPD